MISQISIGQMELINVLILRDKLEILIILFLWYSFSPMKKKEYKIAQIFYLFYPPIPDPYLAFSRLWTIKFYSIRKNN